MLGGLIVLYWRYWLFLLLLLLRRRYLHFYILIVLLLTVLVPIITIHKPPHEHIFIDFNSTLIQHFTNFIIIFLIRQQSICCTLILVRKETNYVHNILIDPFIHLINIFTIITVVVNPWKYFLCYIELFSPHELHLLLNSPISNSIIPRV